MRDAGSAVRESFCGQAADAIAAAGAGMRTAPHVWRMLGRAGLIAELYAGAGPRPDTGRLGDLLSALDASCEVGVALSVCVQVATSIPILLGGRASQAVVRACDAALDGTAVTALCATDAGAAGSSLAELTTTVRLADDHLVVDGGKRWIAGACFSDQLLVLARHRPGDHFTSFTWVLVPAAAPGVTVEPADTGFFAGSGVGHVRLDGVRLGRDHVVGRVGEGLVSFGRHVATERLAGGMWAAAIARRALAGTHDSLLRRTVRGRTLWDNDAVRLAFARCLVEHRRLEAMCQQAAEAIGGPDALLASMLLKAGAADALEKILAACSQLHGADGFRTGGIQQLRAEAAMFGIAGGTTETMLAAVADRAADLLAVRPS